MWQLLGGSWERLDHMGLLERWARQSIEGPLARANGAEPLKRPGPRIWGALASKG